MWRYLRDPAFSRFDTIPECDGHTHTDRQTDTRRRHIPRLARRRAVKYFSIIIFTNNANSEVLHFNLQPENYEDYQGVDHL